MKVGLFLTNQQFLVTDMIAALDDQIAMVHHARNFGWDTLLSGQHYLNEGNNQQLQLVPFLARLIPEAGDMNIALGILLDREGAKISVCEYPASGGSRG